jgi:hypothetical protein
VCTPSSYLRLCVVPRTTDAHGCGIALASKVQHIITKQHNISHHPFAKRMHRSVIVCFISYLPPTSLTQSYCISNQEDPSLCVLLTVYANACSRCIKCLLANCWLLFFAGMIDCTHKGRWPPGCNWSYVRVQHIVHHTATLTKLNMATPISAWLN